MATMSAAGRICMWDGGILMIGRFSGGAGDVYGQASLPLPKAP